MNTVKLVAVFAENKPGQVARVAKILADARINIRCITVASSGAYGVMKLLVNQPEPACRLLKLEGFAATLMEVIAVEMTDQPGALHTVTDCLFKNAINVDNTSGFVANHHAVLVVEVHDVPAPPKSSSARACTCSPRTRRWRSETLRRRPAPFALQGDAERPVDADTRRLNGNLRTRHASFS